MQGNLTNSMPAGFSLRSSIVPQSGTLDGAPASGGLGMPVEDGDIVYTMVGGSYVAHNYFGGWAPQAPVPKVGEGFFVFKQNAANWVRSFNVNQ
jgi:hypothetical protein